MEHAKHRDRQVVQGAELSIRSRTSRCDHQHSNFAVVNYVLPVSEIIKRLNGRQTCEVCQAVFHRTHLPPKQDGVCDHCGGRLYQREDDCLGSIAARLEAYEHTTEPLIQFYRNLGLLTVILASGSREEVVCAHSYRAWAATQKRKDSP